VEEGGGDGGGSSSKDPAKLVIGGRFTDDTPALVNFTITRFVERWWRVYLVTENHVSCGLGCSRGFTLILGKNYEYYYSWFNVTLHGAYA